jgi:MoxR-like ATPase
VVSFDDFKNLAKRCFDKVHEFDIDFELGVSQRKLTGLDKIEGHEGPKRLVARTLKTPEQFNTLFIGPPGSAKTMFLKAIQEMYSKWALYIDATNSTNGVLYEIAARKPKIVLIDEIEKMPRNYQEKLLNFAMTGQIKIDKVNKNIDVTIPGVKIYATANDLKRITPPLKSRFRRIWIPPYDEEDFVLIAKKIFPHLVANGTAEFLARAVWLMKGDIRDMESYGKLVQPNDTQDSIIEMVHEWAMNSEPTEAGVQQNVKAVTEAAAKTLQEELDEATKEADQLYSKMEQMREADEKESQPEPQQRSLDTKKHDQSAQAKTQRRDSKGHFVKEGLE